MQERHLFLYQIIGAFFPDVASADLQQKYEHLIKKECRARGGNALISAMTPWLQRLGGLYLSPNNIWMISLAVLSR